MLTFWAIAENLSTLSVSSYAEALWLTFTIMQTFPLPLKKPWKKWVSLLSRKGMCCCSLEGNKCYSFIHYSVSDFQADLSNNYYFSLQHMTIHAQAQQSLILIEKSEASIINTKIGMTLLGKGVENTWETTLVFFRTEQQVNSRSKADASQKRTGGKDFFVPWSEAKTPPQPTLTADWSSGHGYICLECARKC